MWYYSNDGQQQGPLDDAALDQLILNRTVGANTFLWRDGFTEWMPFGQVQRRPVMPVPSVAPSFATAPATCTICGKAVGAENLIDLLGQRVCATCKPLVVQSVQEGATLASSNTAWSENKKVVTRDQAELPARCFKCNQIANGPPLKRQVSWHHPALYLIALVGLLLYVIVAVIVRKKGTVEIHLCDRHKQRRKNFIIGGWSLAGVAFLTSIIGMVADVGALTAIGFLLLPVALIGGIAGASLARATRIKGTTIWLGGAGKEFVASLPPWAG